LIRFLIVVLVLSAVMLIAVRNLFETPPTWDLWIVVYLAITTAAVYLFLYRRNDPEKFTQIYLLSITVKILLSCGFVLTFILTDPAGDNFNAIFFMIGYVIFTALEVVFLLLKKIS
jgi:hypothetical protein